VQSSEDVGDGRAADGGGDVCGGHCGVGFGERIGSVRLILWIDV
jgi:hypothetical protein